MSCSHRANDIIFGKAKTIAVDETKVVLLRHPQKLSIINDSCIMMINSSQKLSEYNFYSGKNSYNFSLTGFDFDSLLSATYRKKYEGIKRYSYETGFEMNGNNYQLVNYYHTKSRNYILVSTMAQVDDLLDSTRDLHVHIIDYVNFLFETDEQLRTLRIFPLYAETRIRQDNYYAYFAKNFFVKDNFVYVPVTKSHERMQLVEQIDTLPGNYNIATIGLQENSVEYLLSNQYADFKDYRLQDYFDAECSYLPAENKLMICTGKEVIDLQTSAKVFSKKELKPTEWIYRCCKKDDYLLMTTYTKEHQKNAVMNGLLLPVDSIVSEEIKIFDIKQQKMVCTKKLPAEAKGAILSPGQLVYINKDDKHYYFNSIAYEH